MAGGNAQAGLRGKLLQLHLPKTVASPIGTAFVSNNEELFTRWVGSLSHALPPPSETCHSKFGGLVVDVGIDHYSVVDEVINAIGDSFPVCDGAVIIHTDTASPAPLACYSLPLFLKLPISSFFLQSTEIIGRRWVRSP